MLRPLALAAIGGYQRFLSPHKGWRCAYGALHGRGSCSDFGRRAIVDYGVVGGVRLLFRRFRGCRTAALAFVVKSTDEEIERDGVGKPFNCSTGLSDNQTMLCCTLADVVGPFWACA